MRLAVGDIDQRHVGDERFGRDRRHQGCERVVVRQTRDRHAVGGGEMRRDVEAHGRDVIAFNAGPDPAEDCRARPR